MSEYDVVIVGGGAAGLSAALVLARARRRVAVVDAGSPRNRPAAHMQGYLTRDGVAPQEFVAVGRAEVRGYGGELIDDTVTGIEPGLRVRLAGGDVLSARRVLVTTGLRDELPHIPGASQRWGRDLLHCPYCHGHEVRDQPLGVIGGSADAVSHALLIPQWSPDVIFFTQGYALSDDERAKLAARAIRIVDGSVTGLVVSDDRLVGVEIDGGDVVPRAAVFVRPRFVPNSSLLTDLGCTSDDAGWVTVDAAGATSVAGVYAAGNAVDPRAQVINAAAAGSAAAIAINNDLVEEDCRAGLRGPGRDLL
jgi:thioredoxin reductase